MKRTPLATLQGGPIRRAGDPRISARLARALDVEGDAALAELTHGFHSYPARMHPLIARRLLEDVPPSAERPRVLDPFCGSGTTLVEAVRRGAAGQGVDLNPLAVALARLKSSVWSAARRDALASAAERVVEEVQQMVRSSRSRRSPPTKISPATRFDDPRYYPKHVFPELVALRLTIDEVCQDDPELTGALRLVLSSIVLKVSLQRSDTDETLVQRAIARGAATRHFAARTVELVERLGHLAVAVPKGTPPVNVRVGDARQLTHVDAASIDVVVTSPPYLGTYDYTRHHLRRLGWLGLPQGPLRGGELGARRSTTVAPARALATWRTDMAACLAELLRVLRPGGTAYFLLGDATLAGAVEWPPVDEEMAALGTKAGLALVARAAQPRGTHRAEHLLALRRGK